jgi:hypothetical protein
MTFAVGRKGYALETKTAANIQVALNKRVFHVANMNLDGFALAQQSHLDRLAEKSANARQGLGRLRDDAVAAFDAAAAAKTNTGSINVEPCAPGPQESRGSGRKKPADTNKQPLGFSCGRPQFKGSIELPH